jgi:hypothetical protein
MNRPLGLFLFVLALTGCAHRAQPNSNCDWPPEIAGARDAHEDAEFAEDLAIRYADARRGPHSGHFDGMAEYGRTRDQCMVKLFQIVGSNHGVTQEQVRHSLAHRRVDLDLAVILPFAVFYAWAADFIARRISQRHADRRDTSAWAVMTVYTSVIAGAVGALAAEVWSGLVESVRLGTGHLSYRAERIPWNHHGPGMFVAGLAVFWFLATLHYRAQCPLIPPQAEVK